MEALTQPHRRGWHGSWGPWQAGNTTLELKVLGGLWFQPVPSWELGPAGGWDLSEALAPVLFSAHPEEDVAPSSDPHPALWVWDQGLGSLRGRQLSWQLELEAVMCRCPQETEGMGLQETATCSSPLAFGPRARLGTFDHPLPHPQQL